MKRFDCMLSHWTYSTERSQNTLETEGVVEVVDCK